VARQSPAWLCHHAGKDPINPLCPFQFDAGLARFQAMRVANYEHFKPTGKSFRTGLFAVVLPIALYAWALKAERDGREEKYRTGQVAYKDRQFKFI